MRGTPFDEELYRQWEYSRTKRVYDGRSLQARAPPVEE
jgi:hypothetical protein